MRPSVAAPEPVGGIHGDAPDDVVPDRALDLEHHRPPFLGLDLERLEKFRLVARCERDVDHRADDLAHVTDARLLLVRGWMLRARGLLGLGHFLPLVQLDARIASAPLTISISSVVMPAWRTLLAKSVNASIRSPAAFVAFCIAIIFAEYSLALFSSTAWKTCVST
jgi:hypothetical protein